MASRAAQAFVGSWLVLSGCSGGDASPEPSEPKPLPVVACAVQPRELPRPPAGQLPCELIPPSLIR
jgi:hypothetical protein